VTPPELAFALPQRLSLNQHTHGVVSFCQVAKQIMDKLVISNISGKMATEWDSIAAGQLS
jgi:hypothetical protein